MPVEGRRNVNRYTFMDAGKLFHDARQVTLQMNAKREEIRQNNDAFRTPRDQIGNGLRQVRRGAFQKSRLDQRIAALAGHLFRDRANGIIRARHARSVSEDDQPSPQAPPLI